MIEEFLSLPIKHLSIINYIWLIIIYYRMIAVDMSIRLFTINIYLKIRQYNNRGCGMVAH